MKKIYLLGFCLSFAICSSAQFESVNYDYEKNWFGQNQLLPAETPWIVNGAVPENIELVEIGVFASTRLDKDALDISTWNKPIGADASEFYVPINYSLRGNTEYTIQINYYRKTSAAELSELRRQVDEAANSLLDLNIVSNKNSIDLQKNPKLIKQDLDKLVGDGLLLYRNELQIAFPGFSQLITDQLENLEQLRLKDGRFNVLKKEENKENDERVLYFKQQVDNLKALVDREINQYLSFNFYTLESSRLVKNYKTERTRNELSLNAGFGGIYDGGDVENLSYAGAPFVGISFPLANPNLSGKFWSNSAISAGVFLRDFEFDDNTDFSGPLIDRPFYLAYGYRVLYFLRLNAGATILENADGTGDVFARPFVGLSLELNVWLGLGKKN